MSERESLDSELRGPTALLRRRAALIGATILAAVAGALLYSVLQDDRYLAEAAILAGDRRLSDTIDRQAFPEIDTAGQFATDLELATIEEVARLTAERLGGRVTTEEIEDNVEIQRVATSNVLSVTAVAGTPTLAATLANTFIDAYIDFRREVAVNRLRQARRQVTQRLESLEPGPADAEVTRGLRREIAQLATLESVQTGDVEVVQSAVPPASRSAPQPMRNAVLGGIVGVFIALALAFLAERYDRRIRNRSELEERFGAPVIAAIPESESLQQPLASTPGGTEDAAEAFRMLRNRIRYAAGAEPIRSVLITSPAGGDGKTTVAMGLAVASTRAGARTLLLEGDFRGSTLAERVGAATAPGLAELLSGSASREEVTQTVGGGKDGFELVTVGNPTEDPLALLEGEAAAGSIAELIAAYSLVIVDAGPLTSTADAIPLLDPIDAVVAVAVVGRTTIDNAGELRETLQDLGAPLLGVVANRERAGRGGGVRTRLGGAGR